MTMLESDPQAQPPPRPTVPGQPQPAEQVPASAPTAPGSGLPGGPDPVGQEEEFRLPQDFLSGETEALVQRAHAGDVDALNALFARYYELVVEVARRRLGPRLRSKEDPDDLAQTAFREATRDFRAYVYRGEGSLLRWLVHILQNKIRDRAEFYSARKRDSTRERALDDGKPNAEGAVLSYDPPSEDLSVTRQVQRQEEFAILRQALERLSAEHRQAITLVFFEGLTLREAGERMDRSEDAVRMLLRRAESNLHEILKRRVDHQS